MSNISANTDKDLVFPLDCFVIGHPAFSGALLDSTGLIS